MERLWADTVARARSFTERRSTEASFIETPRHLNFASAAWLGP
ncbi:hypothetical protein [Nonomuraea aridisoli]|nr:hypothetical protein [Nonomuraea aridisoli]